MGQGAADKSVDSDAREELPATRDRILDAALAAFVEHGFEAASTRDIARRAGVQQPLLNYHFGSKENLWKAAVDYFFDDTADRFRERIRGYLTPEVNLATRLRQLIRDLVYFSAHNPELSRFLLREGWEGPGREQDAGAEPRLEWLVRRHFRTHFQALEPVLTEASQMGLLPDASPICLFYMLAGMTSTIYLHEEECRLLSGEDQRKPDRVEEHARAVAELVLGSFESTERSLRNQERNGLGSNLLRPTPSPG